MVHTVGIDFKSLGYNNEVGTGDMWLGFESFRLIRLP